MKNILIYLVLVILLPVFVCAELVSYYSFDDSADLGKDYVGSNNGIVRGGVTWTPGGFVNGAVIFDGINDYINCGNDQSLDMQSFTLTAWVKLDDVVGNNNLIARKTQNPLMGWAFFSVQSSGKLSFDHMYGDGTANTHKSYTGNTPLQTDTWYHIAVTVVNGGSIKFYLDGDLDAEKTMTQTFSYPNGSLMIGRSESGYYGGFTDGMIDEIRICNHILSSEEILALYNQDKQTGGQGDLDADLNFDTRVDIDDLIIVASNFGSADDIADTDSNGIVDIFDIVFIASRFGTTSQSGSPLYPTREGNVVSAISCDLNDVYAAVDFANNGEIVQIPEGICDWDETLTTKKEIHLRGAGKDKTILRRMPSAPRTMVEYDATYDAPDIPNTERFKFSGIKLQDLGGPYENGYEASRVSEGLIIQSGAEDFLVYDSEFEGFSHACVLVKDYIGTSDVRPDGRSKGVIYNNRFINCYMQGLGYGVHVSGNQEKNWDIYPLDIGSEQAVFIEDNYFTGCRHAVASGYGSRYICRYNFFEGNRRSHTIDAHGWPMPETNRGSRLYEIYENTVVGNDEYDPDGIQIRGGDGVIFNNTMHTFIAYSIILSQDNQGICRETGWPCKDQIRELHMWGNTEDGSLINATGIGNALVRLVHPGIEQTLQEGRDFFFYPRPGYTPYQYPHPLRDS